MKIHLSTRLITKAATLVLLASAFSLSQLAAADRTWTGLGTNNNWTTSSNWNAVVAAGDSLFFAGTTRLTPSNDFPSGTAFINVTFPGTGAFALLGNPIALGGNITNNQPSGTETIGLDLAPTANAFINIVSNGFV